MGSRRVNGHLPYAAVVLAALACLQPGIDPVFLALLSRAHGVPFAFHGWIVGATQTGMALGSLTAWRFGARLPLRLPAAAAMAALSAGLATASIAYPVALLAIRFAYGTAMGLVYTQAMAQAAASRPSGAYGAVFLSQLVLSAGVAAFLPMLAGAGSERVALAGLCLVPLAVLGLALWIPAQVLARPARRTFATVLARSAGRRPERAAWLLAAATFLFVAATMMVWTFVGSMAVSAHLGEAVLGRAVALGSIAGALTALAVLRERPFVPPVVSGAAAGLALLAPIFATGPAASGTGFVVAVILFNIGSTAIIVRSSGLASAASGDWMFRRFVSCTHCLGMIAGPVAGSAARMVLGEDALLFAASVPVGAGCLALLAAAIAGQKSLRGATAAPAPDRLRLAEVRCPHVSSLHAASVPIAVRRECEGGWRRVDAV